jgi:prophage tail gpP-like protein
MSTLQEQAEWMCRVARGNAMPARITVLGYRAGSRQVLWRPNQVTALWDPYSGKDRDMLIAGVEFLKSEEGSWTRLRLVGPSAYDRINEAERHRRRRAAAPTPAGNLITTVPDQ